MRVSGSPDRSVAVVVVGVALALLLAVALVVVWTAVRGHAPPSPGASTPSPAAAIAPEAGPVAVLPAVQSLAVLRDWDRARAEAWATADVAALRRLYLPGSRAGRHDVAMLQRWRGRGLQVEGMSMQVLSVELRQRTTRRLVLVVTDRLVGAEAVRAGASASTRGRPLPHDRPTTRRLSFRKSEGRWRLASATSMQ